MASRRRALLGDSMGLGKTAQAFAATDLVGAETVLVICPASVRPHWPREAMKWSRRVWSPQVIETTTTAIDPAADLIVCSYAGARAPTIHAQLMARRFGVLILDEVQSLRSRATQQTKAIYGRRCDGAGGLLEWATHAVGGLSGSICPNGWARELYAHLRAFGVTTLTEPGFDHRFHVLREFAGDLLQMRRQPGACGLPVPLDGDHGDLQHLRHVLFAQPAEEPQFDNSRGARVRRRKCGQQRVQIEQLLARRSGTRAIHRRQPDALLLTTTLVGDARARVIDQDPAHRLRGDREEVDPVLVRHRLAADEAEVQLVDDGVRLQRVIGPLPLEQSRGERAQLRMHDRKEPVARPFVPGTPVGQPAGDLRRVEGWSRRSRHDTDTLAGPL